MAIKSINLNFPEQFLVSLEEDFDDELLVSEAKISLSRSSDQFQFAFSSSENLYQVINYLRKLVIQSSSLTDFFHSHNLLSAIIFGITEKTDEIKTVATKLTTELKKRLDNLNLEQLAALSEFAKSEQYLDPQSINLMLQYSHFPSQQESWPIAINLLEKDYFSDSNQNIWLDQLLSLRIFELNQSDSKRNYLNLLKHFLALGIQNVDKEKLKSCFLNFLESFDLEKDLNEQHELIILFDLTVNKYFTLHYPLPIECVELMARFPEFSLTPEIQKYAMSFFESKGIEDRYIKNLLTLFSVQIVEVAKKERIFGGSLAPLLLSMIMEQDKFRDESESDELLNQMIAVLRFGSGALKIDLDCTKKFQKYFLEQFSRIAFSTVGAICSVPDNFEDKRFYQKLLDAVAKKVGHMGFRLYLMSPICAALLALIEAGEEIEGQVIQNIRDYSMQAVYQLTEDDRAMIIKLFIKVLTPDTAHWPFWRYQLKDEELDEKGYLCEAILRNVGLELDDEMWNFFCYKTGPTRSIQIFSAMAKIAAEGNFPRERIVMVMYSHAGKADRTLGLFRAWIKNQNNEKIEPEVGEIFRVCGGFPFNYSDAVLFEVHCSLLEREENGSFQIKYDYVKYLLELVLEKFIQNFSASDIESLVERHDGASSNTSPKRKDCVDMVKDKNGIKIIPDSEMHVKYFEYIRACVEFPMKNTTDLRSFHYGVDMVLKYDFNKVQTTLYFGIEPKLIKEYLVGHVQAGNKYPNENGEDKVLQGRDKVVKYLENNPI